MADEPRRSGRATKGQHTKDRDLPDAPPASKRQKAEPKKKGGSRGAAARSVEPEEEGADEDDDAVIRCVCGVQEDDGERQMICCDQCEAWQHIICLGLEEGKQWDDRTYLCEKCKPADHQALLAAMERGEQPWVKWIEDFFSKKRKGKKGKAKARQAMRQSEIRSVKSEDASTPKPQLPSSSQDLGQGAQGMPADVSNGHIQEPSEDHQDQSSAAHYAAGKKRRTNSHHEGQPANAKRRKSDQAGQIADNPSQLPSDRRKLTESLFKDMAGLTREAARQGRVRIPDGDTADSLCIRLAMAIDHALVKNHGTFSGKESPYFQKFNSIRFNLKNNPALLYQLVSASLTPDALTMMSAEEMASEEKQRQYAALREENDKQAVLVHDEGPRIRKTHKGDELIDHDGHVIVDEAAIPRGIVRRHESEVVDDALPEPLPEGGSPRQVELPEDVGRQPLTVDTSTSSASNERKSSAFNIQQVWSSVHSPDNSQRVPAHGSRRQSSMTGPPSAQPLPDDADIDRLLKDEDPDYVPDFTKDASISWHGSVRMEGVGQFSAVARFVGGGDVGLVYPWSAIIPSTLEIKGRIDAVKANGYISHFRGSTTTDVAVLALTPIDSANRDELNRIFDYFHQRQRWGVVGNYTHPAVRDLYIIPLVAGEGGLPPFIELLEEHSVESQRSDNTLLITIATRTRSPPQSADVTPQQSLDSQAPSIATPAHHTNSDTLMSGTTPAPVGFSPITHGYGGTLPPNPYGSPYSTGPVVSAPPPPSLPPTGLPGKASPPTITPLATQILGPFVNSPVAMQVLQANPDQKSLLNLRDILERNPLARTDLTVLSQMLAQSGGSS